MFKHIFFFIAFFSVINGFGENFKVKSLFGHFERTILTNSETETVKGSFYYIVGKHIYFDITYPLKQAMIVDGKETIIYYPDDPRAFILESEKPVALPLVTGLFAASIPDYGLSAFGFKITDQKFDQDTLISYWTHPKASEEFGHFEIAQFEDHLFYYKYFDADNKQVSETYFHEFVELNGLYFPLQVRATNKTASTVMKEVVTLSNLEADNDFPDEVIHYKIPDDKIIERKKW